MALLSSFVSRVVALATKLGRSAAVLLSNSFVGRSVALAVSTALLQGLTAAAHAAVSRISDAFFLSVHFSANTPQATAAAFWLQTQPAVRASSRRVVVDARPEVVFGLAAAEGSRSPSASPPSFELLPSPPAGSVLRVRWRGHFLWVRNGVAATGDLKTSPWCARVGPWERL